MEIGSKLKSLRIGKGFEPIDMAMKLSISETTYRRYERNEARPDINMLEKIAKALDKSIIDLLPEGILFNNSDQKGGVALAYQSTINQQSEKLIESLENQILLLQDKIINQGIKISDNEGNVNNLQLKIKDLEAALLQKKKLK